MPAGFPSGILSANAMQFFQNKDYLIAAACDEIIMPPSGSLHAVQRGQQHVLRMRQPQRREGPVDSDPPQLRVDRGQVAVKLGAEVLVLERSSQQRARR